MSGLSDAISFFTILPAGSGRSMSRNLLYYLTITGLITGLISGTVFYIAGLFFTALTASVSAVSILLLVTGFTHLDGVMDSGDALMVRGTPERRIEALKDRYTGAGAVGMAMAVYLPTIAFLSLFTPLQGLVVIVMSELLSKMSYLFMLHRATTFNDGLARHFSSLLSGHAARIMALNSLVFVLIGSLLYPVSLLSLIPVLAVTYALKRRFYSLFGGINGDLLALNGELARLSSIIFLASATLLMPPFSLISLGYW